MIIPDTLYNPRQEDQSLKGYIEAYDDSIDIILDRIKSGAGFPEIPGFSQHDLVMGLEFCFRVNIALRMIQILEKHCDEEPTLVVLKK